MPTTIKLKNSVTTTNVPSSLAQGEVAINVTDKKVWVGNAATTPVQLLGTGSDGSFTNLTVSGTTALNGGTTLGDASGDALTINSSAVSIPNGLTFNSGAVTLSSNPILSAGTANGVAYLNGSKVVTSGSAFTFDGTNGLGFGTGGTGTTTAVLTLKGSNATNSGSAITGTRNGAGSWFIGDAGAALGGGNTGFIYYNYVLNDTWRWWDGGAGAERMRLTSTGLGIGTSSPSTKLEIAVSSGSATQSRQFFQASGASAAASFMRLTNTGADAVIGIADSGGTAIVSGGTAYATQIYTVNSTPLQFGTNSSVKATLDSSGNLGLGVTPSAWGLGKALEVGNSGNAVWSVASGDVRFMANSYFNGSNYIYSSTNPASYYRQSDGIHQWYSAPSGTAGNAVTFSERMRITSTGQVGIGTSTPGTTLNVFTASTTEGLRIQRFAGAYYSELRQTDNPEGLAFLVGDGSTVAERMRITGTGNLLVGKTTTADTTVGCYIGPTGKIGLTSAESTNSFSTLDTYSTGAGQYRFYVGMSGTVFATSTTITAISDQRLKENIVDLDDGLDAVMALKPRKFDWKEGKGKDIKGDRGWIAQEFEQVFPEMIDEWKDPAPEGEEPYKAVNANLIPILVKAIQEQQSIINDLKARIETLESK